LNDYDLGHIVDKSNGGDFKKSNLATMHRKCNLAKPKHTSLQQAINWKLNRKIDKSPPKQTPAKQPSLYHPREFRFPTPNNLEDNVNNTGQIPPYTSYLTFLRFLDYLRRGIPDNINRDYWGKYFSGSSGTHLIATCKYLGLINRYSHPNQSLISLVSAENYEQRRPILQDVTKASYSYVFNSVNLETITHKVLDDFFKTKFQLTPSLLRKCVKFFIELVKDANLPLSPTLRTSFRRSIIHYHRISLNRTVP
jgi:hypothetical protein